MEVGEVAGSHAPTLPRARTSRRRTRYDGDVDRTTARLHLLHAESALLRYAREVRTIADELDALDAWGDPDVAIRRGLAILGMGADYRDDANLWLPQSRAGRVLLALARVTLRAARWVG